MLPSIEVARAGGAWHRLARAANRSPVTLLSTARALLLAAVAALAACASSEPPPPATAAHFDAIQRQEAIQDEVRVAVLESEGECPRVCEGTARGCAAADRICEIATSVTDADAQARCELARDRCAQYRAAAARCECP